MSETLTAYIQTFFMSMLPIAEIRGSVPWGLAHVDQTVVNYIGIYITSVIGNFLPVPFIILLFRPIIKFLKKTKLFKRFAHWLEERTHRKAGSMLNSEKAIFATAFALYVFVSIPFPTTGAWTGAMIAALLNIRYKYALPSILLGIMTSGAIMMLLTSGIIHFM